LGCDLALPLLHLVAQDGNLMCQFQVLVEQLLAFPCNTERREKRKERNAA
jgi:hypothetical protein